MFKFFCFLEFKNLKLFSLNIKKHDYFIFISNVTKKSLLKNEAEDIFVRTFLKFKENLQ